MFLLVWAIKTLGAALFVSAVSIQMAHSEAHFEQVQERMTVNVGLTLFPPFIKQDPDGTCLGSVVDEITSTFRSEKYQLSVYCASPARVYRDLSNGMIDLTVNVKSTEKMAKHVYFSNAPAVNLEVVMLSYPQREVRSISAIREFSYGSAREDLENQGLEIIEGSNSKAAVAVFLRGGSDAILTYRRPFDFYYQEMSASNALSVQSAAFEEVSLGKVSAFFVINEKSQNADELLRIVNTRQ